MSGEIKKTPDQVIEEMKEENKKKKAEYKKKYQEELRKLKQAERKIEQELIKKESLKLGRNLLKKANVKSEIEFNKKYDVVEKGNRSNFSENKNAFDFDEEQGKALIEFLETARWCYQEVNSKEKSYKDNSVVTKSARLYEKLIKQS